MQVKYFLSKKQSSDESQRECKFLGEKFELIWIETLFIHCFSFYQTHICDSNDEL